MDLQDVVWLVVAVGFSVDALIRLPRHWRTPETIPPSPRLWSWSEDWWRATERAVPMLSVWFAVTIGILLADEAGWADAWPRWHAAPLLAGPVLVLPIALFNRPRLLVAPGLRGEPGNLRVMRVRRRTHRLDLARRIRIELAGGSLEFSADGQIVARSPAGEARLVAPGLTGLAVVVLWEGRDWVCFIGESDAVLYGWWPGRAELRRLGRLARLGAGGGEHRVEFLPLRGGDLLVCHELGEARVSAAGELVREAADPD